MKKNAKGGWGVIGAAVVGGLLVGMTTASAETNFNYNSISASLIGVSLDKDLVINRGDLGGNVVRYSSLGGVGVSGSFQVDNNFVLGAGYSYVSNSGFGTKFEQATFAIGGAYVVPVGPNTDLQVGLDFIRLSAEACNLIGCSRQTENGYGVGGGVRHWANENLEVNGSLGYTDIRNTGSSTTLGLGGAYWFNSNSSVLLNLAFNSDANSAGLGFRYAF